MYILGAYIYIYIYIYCIYILQWVYNVNMILHGNIMLYLGAEGKGIEETGMVYLFKMLAYIINVV